MESEKKALNLILEQLKDRACLKQDTYFNLREVFDLLKEEAKDISHLLDDQIHEIDSHVVVEFTQVSEFEFRVKFGGDILIFYMQSNIITFNDDFPVMQSPYIEEDHKRRYFGHITIYNFLADSIRYNRLDDPGYLIARILVNSENHFFAEGVRQLNFLFQDISDNIITKEWLRLIIEKSMSAAIEMDLIGPKYPEIKNITLHQKTKEQMAEVRGAKIGFQMSYQNQITG